jgi:hypothetical protein
MNDKDKLDRLLDQTLAEYSDAKPRAGLEQRILAKLAAQQDQRGWRWRWLWVAGPVLVAMALVMLFALRPAPKRDTNVAAAKPPVMQSASAPKKVAPHASVVAGVQPKRKVHPSVVAKAQPTREPRLATFPAPGGDEQQARLLLSFVTRHPDKAKEVVREEEEFQQMAEANMNQESDNRSERRR